MKASEMRAIRAALGLSQAEMVKVLCVHRVTIAKYETGRVVPSPTVAMCYAELQRGWRPRILREMIQSSSRPP